jgi:hypothetical protein
MVQGLKPGAFKLWVNLFKPPPREGPVGEAETRAEQRRGGRGVAAQVEPFESKL